MINVGILGAGLSARVFHLPFLNTLKDTYQVVAISTSNPEKIKNAVNDAIVFYSDAESVITREDIDLIIVTTPDSTHFKLAELALNHNKHVIVEKPIVDSVSDAMILYQLAEQKNRILTAYQNRRWDGDFLTVKSLIENQKIGALKYFESCFHKFVPQVRDRWREKKATSAGFWFDLGAHTVDQAVHLFGLPKSVTGRCLNLRDNAETNDYAIVTFHYPYKEVVFKVNPFVASPMPRFTLHGTKGSYVKYFLDIQESQLVKQGMSVNDTSFGKEPEGRYGKFYDEHSVESIPTQRGNFANLYRDLADAIKNNKPSPVNPKEVIYTLYLLNLAVESSEKGQTLAVVAPM